MRAQLTRWQERLLDLSRANPLLGINRSRVSKLRVAEPAARALFRDFVVEERVLRMPRAAARRGGSPGDEQEGSPQYLVEPGDLAFDATPAELHRRLRRICDNARTSVEERGVTTLHLSLAVLRWEDPQLGDSVSPLWLVPCVLESHGPSAAMRLSRADEEVQLNPALELYLRERHRVTLPSIPDEVSAEVFAAVLEDVRGAVREQGWKVEDEMWLSTYSFESLVLYQDLRALESQAEGHPIVASLAKAVPLPEGSEALGEETLDALPTPDLVPQPVHPADSSQLAALTVARTGKHVVVHGPPGTGKSQTITNLIADAIGRGLKVLFVSAKMAALDVVHQRIEDLGLARFCLEAHSTKAGKARIIDDLRRTLAAAEDGGAGGELDDQLEDLRRVRAELNTYIHEVHTRRAPLGLSVYTAIGRAERLCGEADVRAALPWANLLEVSRPALNEALDALRDLAVQAEVFDARASHPWRGLAVDAAAPPRFDVIEPAVRAVRETVAAIARDVETTRPLLGCAGERVSLSAVEALAEALTGVVALPRMPAAWGERALEDLAAAAARLEQAAGLAAERRTKQGEYDAALRLPPDGAVQQLAPVETQFNRWSRPVDPAYWRWRKALRPHLVAPPVPGFSTLRAWLLLARRLVELRDWFDAHRDELAREVGVDKILDPQALAQGAHALRVTERLRRSISDAGLPGPEGSPSLSPEVRGAVRSMVIASGAPALREAIGVVETAWPGGFVDGQGPRSAGIAVVIPRAGEVLASPEKFHEWVVLQHTLARCGAAGLAPFVDALGTLSAQRAPGAFERLFYRSWASSAMGASTALAVFAGLRHEERIRQFRDLDNRVRRMALARISVRAAHPARRIATAQGGVGAPSEVGVLRRELQRQRGFKPLRKLFGEIPNVLQALKPCMLMSPLSVSTFLKPGGVTFDLVVFDEASQLPTPEAIPAVLRARQVVVAGDVKQLPPTSFFAASVIFDESAELRETEELEPLESFLDDCVAIVPVFDEVHLRWHYRSRDERLIRFSNHYFYRERALVTFPSARQGSDTGVRLDHVADGQWDRGGSRTNRAEARRVAELVVEQLTLHPDRSLGVVAMNVTQREAIEEALDERWLERPDLAARLQGRADEPFFLKALESVQGDERDTIIISVGYGRAPDGGFSFNFGPLNQDSGWRRLNVLVTRARWTTILVTSLRARDLAGVNPNNRGAVALRNYIEYAEREGELPPGEAVMTSAETNDFEDAVAEVLRAHGFQVDQQVGASGYRIDLGVKDLRIAFRYLLGVECDGATYHSARTARDRDLVRHEVLRQQGWRLYRVWSTDWFRDRERAVQRLLAAVEQALREPPESSVAAAPPAPAAQSEAAGKASRPLGEGSDTAGGAPATSPTAPATPVAVSRRYRRGEPYLRHRERGFRDLLLDREQRGRLAEQVVRVVRAEGPIHLDVLVDRLKEINGVARVGANVQSNIDGAIGIAVRRKTIERVTGDFLRLPSTRPSTFRTPGDDVHRGVGQVPPDELELAVLYLVEDQWGYQRDAIPRTIAGLLGFERTPVGAAETIGSIVDTLVERGLLIASGPNVRVADR